MIELNPNLHQTIKDLRRDQMEVEKAADFVDQTVQNLGQTEAEDGKVSGRVVDMPRFHVHFKILHEVGVEIEKTFMRTENT